MPEMLRYGVFRLEQTWTLVGEDGVQLGFSSRGQALTAGLTAVAAHRAFGQAAELVVQDRQGRLIKIEEADLNLDHDGVPPDAVWDPFPLSSSLAPAR